MRTKAAGTGDDPFRVLPDDVLEHILSLLPGDDALQTCVLDTQWRDFWRRKTSLRFMLDTWSSYSPKRLNQLAKLIIQLRGNSPLTYCQINLCDDGSSYDFTQTKQLIEYVLKCCVEKLSVRFSSEYAWDPLVLEERLISRHLRTIEFGHLDLLDSSLDFSCCPGLEELKLESCCVDVSKICSKSLKHLWLIGWACTFSEDVHIPIDAPRLITLELGDFQGFTPLLAEMPLLEKASISIGRACNGFYESDDEDICECANKCLVLNGLSNAVDLKLIAVPGKDIFKRDLEWCPKFDRLKTLILNEWFTAIDLFCILKHSPILEKLILQLGNTENFVGATGSKQSFACASSLAVNIKCRKFDEGVLKIVEVLSTCGILREQISLKCSSHT